MPPRADELIRDIVQAQAAIVELQKDAAKLDKELFGNGRPGRLDDIEASIKDSFKEVQESLKGIHQKIELFNKGLSERVTALENNSAKVLMIKGGVLLVGATLVPKIVDFIVNNIAKKLGF